VLTEGLASNVCVLSQAPGAVNIPAFSLPGPTPLKDSFMADFTKQFPDKVCSISLLNVDCHFFARWIEAAVATRIDLLSLPASLRLSLSSSFSPFFLFLSLSFHPSHSLLSPHFAPRSNAATFRPVTFPSPQDAEVVVGCASGKRSGMVCEWLNDAGYTKLTDVGGGMGSWTSAGLPTES